MTRGDYQTYELKVLDSSMPTFVFEPEGSGPHPAVVVAQHLPVAHQGIEGDPFTIDVGKRLAAAGYVAVIPFLFHWWPPEQDMMQKAKAWRDDRNIADLEATFAFTESLPIVSGDRIAIAGHCWGGRVAWLGACTNDRYAAAVMFYGGRISMGLGEGAVPALNLAHQIACPLLGIFGNDDHNPSPDDVNEIEQVLTTANVAHEFHRFEGAGHGFQDFFNPERYRPEQSDAAWAIFFDFLDSQLG